MKETVRHLVHCAFKQLQKEGVIPDSLDVVIQVERTKKSAQGEYTSNLALILAKSCGQTVAQLAELIVKALPLDSSVERVEIAGVGFINFFMSSKATFLIISELLFQDETFGKKSLNGANDANSELLALSIHSIQYAHARIGSVFKQLEHSGVYWDRALGLKHVDLLRHPQEIQLISLLNRYPEIIEQAQACSALQQMAYYQAEVAKSLHSYYNAVSLLCEQEELRCARFCLLEAVRRVLYAGLNLLGLSASESM